MQPSTSVLSVLSGLSYALDLTEGHPRGHAVRTALIGLEIGERIGLPEEGRLDLLYALLLKDAGCSANASRVYELFGGPEHEVKRAVWVRDWRKLTQQASYAFRFVGRGGGFTSRLKKLVHLARLGPEASRELFQLRCARGAEIANLMEMGTDVAAAIRSMDEHWDGGGHPEGLARDSIPLYAQIIGLAQVMEIYWGLGGPAEAVRVARQRSGTWFNPRLTRVSPSAAGTPLCGNGWKPWGRPVPHPCYWTRPLECRTPHWTPGDWTASPRPLLSSSTGSRLSRRITHDE